MTAPRKRVGTGRQAEKAALRAVQAFFEDADHIYLPVPGGDDFGKDAYLDIVIDGEVTGDMIALQIKGGEVATAKPVDRLRTAVARLLPTGSRVERSRLQSDSRDGRCNGVRAPPSVQWARPVRAHGAGVTVERRHHAPFCRGAGGQPLASLRRPARVRRATTDLEAIASTR